MKTYPYSKKNILICLDHYAPGIKRYKRLCLNEILNIMINYRIQAIRKRINNKGTYKLLLLLFNNNIVNEITKYLIKIPTKQQIQILHNDIIQFNVLSYLILPSMHIHTLNNNTELCWNNRIFPISQNNNEIGYDLYDKIKKIKES